MSEENKNLEEEVKETANDFTEGAKEAFDNLSNAASGDNKKVIAGVLGILLGGFGVHKFILGYTKEGIIQIIITFVTCGIGSIVGLIEGIIYLTKSDEEFYETYQKNKRPWF
jgi:TM2 domain-containing membrane protein YozV